MGRKMKVCPGLEYLPDEMASDHITEGCMVLEGGAFRGVYSAGVLDALMKADINLRCTIGVSAGAMIGFNYSAGHIGRSARVNLRYRNDPRYVGVKAFRNNQGIIGFDFAFDQVTEDLPFDYERFYRDDRRFVAVASNVETGKAEYFEKGVCGDIFQAIRASASLPYVSKPVNVDGKLCLDGGCSVKIPVRWAMAQGYERIVVIMTRGVNYRRDENSKYVLAKALYHSRPAFRAALCTNARRANHEYQKIDELSRSGRIFLILPSRQIDVSRFESDMEKLGRLYVLGYRDGQAAVPALREYLE